MFALDDRRHRQGSVRRGPARHHRIGRRDLLGDRRSIDAREFHEVLDGPLHGGDRKAGADGDVIAREYAVVMSHVRSPGLLPGLGRELALDGARLADAAQPTGRLADSPETMTLPGFSLRRSHGSRSGSDTGPADR